jgi:hypothetical protein
MGANMFAEFINIYGTQILYTIITAFFGFLGLCFKKIADEFVKDKTKRKVIKDAVKYAEQAFKDLHGEDKLSKALSAASDMLLEKGITITDLELRVLVEAAVAEFNKAFEKKAN